jgi:hypothetical protein
MPTRDEFVSFMSKRGIKAACEVCNQNNWGIPDEGQGLVVSLPVRQSGGNLVLPGPSIDAVVMICSNCGNIRFHASGIVEGKNNA